MQHYYPFIGLSQIPSHLKLKISLIRGRAYISPPKQMTQGPQEGNVISQWAFNVSVLALLSLCDAFLAKLRCMLAMACELKAAWDTEQRFFFFNLGDFTCS